MCSKFVKKQNLQIKLFTEFKTVMKNENTHSDKQNQSLETNVSKLTPSPPDHCLDIHLQVLKLF